MMRKLILTPIIILNLVACASGVIVIDTLPPAADIYIKAKTTEDFQLVGKAPYKVTLSEFIEKYKVDGSFGLEARSEGYLPHSALVTEVPQNADVNVFLNLKAEPKLGENKEAEETARLNLVMDQLFETQRLVKVGRYDDALSQLSRLQEKNPSLSAIFEMQGGVYYMQKDYPKALDSYEKAVRLNPSNLEVASMKKYLEKFVSKGTTK